MKLLSLSFIIFWLLLTVQPVFSATDCTIELENNSSLTPQKIVSEMGDVISNFLDYRFNLLSASSPEDVRQGCHFYGSYVSTPTLSQMRLSFNGKDYFASSSIPDDLEKLSASLVFQMSSESKRAEVCISYPDINECVAKKKLTEAESKNQGGSNVNQTDAGDYANLWHFSLLYIASNFVVQSGELGEDSISDNLRLSGQDNDEEKLGYGPGLEFGLVKFIKPQVAVGAVYRIIRDSKELKLNRRVPVEDEELQDTEIKVIQRINMDMFLLKLAGEIQLKSNFNVGGALLFGFAKSYSKYSIENDPENEYPDVNSYYAENWLYGLDLHVGAGSYKGIAIKMLSSYLVSNQSKWKYHDENKPTSNGSDIADASMLTLGIGFRFAI